MEDRAYSQAPTRFPINTAYVEGWGLYSETLGQELGLYTDPMDRYGHLSEEIFRACRLVVDTGMHALGWSREEAVDYMLAHTAASKENILGEAFDLRDFHEVVLRAAGPLHLLQRKVEEYI